jgi:hypothetical protein
MDSTVASLSYPCTGLDKTPASLDNRHMKVIMLSASRTGCLYALISVKRLNRTQGLSVGARIKTTGPSGVETATFWLVAQCPNKLRQRVPHVMVKILPISAYQNLRNLRKTNSSFITYTLKMETAVSSET